MCPFQGRKVPLGREATRERSHVSQPIFVRNRCFRSRPTGWRSKIRKNTRCGEMVTKTAILGVFRRVDEIWVAADKAFGVGQAEFACRSRLEEAWEWVCCERL